MKIILSKIEFHYTFIIIALGFVLAGYFSNLIVFTSIIIIHELGHYFDEKYHFSSSKQFIKIYKENKTLFKQKTKKEYFAECFKEYVGNHQEKVKPFQSYMETITKKIRQNNK